MSEHIVSSYDVELQDLRRRISEMGGIAEKMLVDSIHALLRRDTPLAQAVIAADTRLDVLQREVEEHAILMIARRQPLAVDLRETISAIRVMEDRGVRAAMLAALEAARDRSRDLAAGG